MEVNGGDLKKFYLGEKETLDCFHEEHNRHFVMELILHTSDVSNPFKPWQLSEAWAKLIVEEFCKQGEREKKEGLEVTPGMDRTMVNLANTQMGFISFIAPLIQGWKIFHLIMIIPML